MPAAPAGSKKKLVMLAVAAVLGLAAAGGGAGWYVMHSKGHAAKQDEAQAKPAPPVFIPVEPFTVNLQPENGDQYLQLTFTLQVAGLEDVDVIKANMPKVRSRLLLLLSGKKASQIDTPEGKQQLSAEIVDLVRQPFEEQGQPQQVTDVLFTSFIIQ